MDRSCGDQRRARGEGEEGRDRLHRPILFYILKLETKLANQSIHVGEKIIIVRLFSGRLSNAVEQLHLEPSGASDRAGQSTQRLKIKNKATRATDSGVFGSHFSSCPWLPTLSPSPAAPPQPAPRPLRAAMRQGPLPPTLAPAFPERRRSGFPSYALLHQERFESPPFVFSPKSASSASCASVLSLTS
jgi:hypothetical protein